MHVRHFDNFHAYILQNGFTTLRLSKRGATVKTEGSEGWGLLRQRITVRVPIHSLLLLLFRQRENQHHVRWRVQDQ
jgi:hypothetical protein